MFDHLTVAPAPADKSALSNDETVALLGHELEKASATLQHAEAGFTALKEEIRTLKDQGTALAAERFSVF